MNCGSLQFKVDPAVLTSFCALQAILRFPVPDIDEGDESDDSNSDSGDEIAEGAALADDFYDLGF